MARPHIEPFVDRDVDFKKMTLPGFPKGMKYKMLSLDTDTGACSMTVRFESGYRQPPGMSYSEMELFILSGSVQYGDKVYGKGNYFFVPAGVSMPAMSSPRGAEGLLFYNYGEPSFLESDVDHPRALRDQLIMVDAYEGLQWKVANFVNPSVAPGCMVKMLRSDPLTHAHSLLYCMTPNYWQDNISYHDCAEESYHIWGTSSMMQFGNLPTGGYFWRPAWINHGAFASELGVLGFGRTDSILHNYFHFNPWSTPEENRSRAAAQLRRNKPNLYKWIRSPDGHNHPHDFEFPAYDYSNEDGQGGAGSAELYVHDHGDGEAHVHERSSRKGGAKARGRR
ncbi:MAG: hypothetical protein AMXMBFR45_19100 [Gammaproteobacteria bacterium]|nr:MAG: DUF4437 domain-containing protein [Pseudomonadota bacterium]MBC6944004.1 DUF4437 domain-containing protein [Gammaproteobacteria bacterium]MCE7895192.1 DUF4437 domain-containing protein [Gammaproteobacteria bacterium PRO8]MDL1880322.1 DUF4437 domain-containing protein [Gammaproteobacteria bacterium PRO2]MCL4776056.1 DUF4437 domain-containing protein [Gammaproteobacteria bacterium]